MFSREELHDIITNLKGEGLSWSEIRDYINAQYDLDLTINAYQKREQRFLRQKLISEQMTQPDELQMMMDLQVESLKPNDYLTQANNYLRRISREETCKDIAEMFAEKMSASYKLPFIQPQEDLVVSDKCGILCISDWHYGIEINNYNNLYNTNIARQRVTKLATVSINYIKKYKLAKLYVVNLGDMIAGRIHSQIKMESRIDSVTQIMEVSEIIAEFLNDLSHHVDIDYYEVLDNHSRLEPNIKESLELESLARITGFYLKQRLKSNDRVCIKDNEYGLDIASFKVFDHDVIGVHGNKDKQKTVIESLSMYTHKFYDLVLTAHLHHFSADESNEVVRISNGSLMGTDSFAQKLRLNSKPSQTLIISTPDNVVEAIHKIDLN